MCPPIYLCAPLSIPPYTCAPRYVSAHIPVRPVGCPPIYLCTPLCVPPYTCAPCPLLCVPPISYCTPLCVPRFTFAPRYVRPQLAIAPYLPPRSALPPSAELPEIPSFLPCQCCRTLPDNIPFLHPPQRSLAGSRDPTPLPCKCTFWVRGGMFPQRAPGACPSRYFFIKYLSLAPNLSPPREVPQVDRTRTQTFCAKHLA